MSTTNARFESIYRAHAVDILAYCGRRTPRAEAMDAASEVFLVVLRRIDDVPDGDRVLPWLYVIASNVLRNRARSQRRRVRLAAKLSRYHEASVPGPEVQIVRNEAHQQVIDALDQLSDKDREIIRLVEWEGLSREVVASMFFVSRAAIDQRMSRAYRRLGRILGANSAEPRTAPVPIEERGEA